MKRTCRLTHALVKHKLVRTEKRAKKILICFSALSIALSFIFLYKLQNDFNKKITYNLSKEVIDKLPIEIKDKIQTNAK
jgi:hypothetical protein